MQCPNSANASYIQNFEVHELLKLSFIICIVFQTEKKKKTEHKIHNLIAVISTETYILLIKLDTHNVSLMCRTNLIHQIGTVSSLIKIMTHIKSFLKNRDKYDTYNSLHIYNLQIHDYFQKKENS